MTQKGTVMAEGKARWLLEGGIDELDDDELAFLLALISLEVDTGRTLTEDELEVLDQIMVRTGIDGEEISHAIKQLVQAKPRNDPPLDWSDLRDHRGRK
jgi:hypothetical protein